MSVKCCRTRVTQSAGAEIPAGKNKNENSAYDGLLTLHTGAGDIMELVDFKSSSFYNFFVCDTLYRNPPQGEKGQLPLYYTVEEPH